MIFLEDYVNASDYETAVYTPVFNLFPTGEGARQRVYVCACVWLKFTFHWCVSVQLVAFDCVGVLHGVCSV